MEQLLTLEEASRYLRINRMTLYKMAWVGKVPVYEVGRQWRFKKAALDSWLEKSQTQSIQRVPVTKTKKCIFLTGATGYLGSNLIPDFIESGYYLKLLVRAKKNNPTNRIIQVLSKVCDDPAKLSILMAKIEIVEGDLAKKNLGLSEDVVKRFSTDITDIFHCAGAVSFDENKEEIIRANNIEGTKNILSFAEKLTNTHFHYMSTAFVCGRKTGKVKEDYLDLGQEFNNAYEESKCKAEKLIRDWSVQNNIKTTIYRPSIIVGDSQTGKTQSAFGLYGILRILDLTTQGLRLKYKKGSCSMKTAGAGFNKESFFIPIRVIGSSNKTLNLVTIDYVRKAIARIFNAKNNAGKTYHITNPYPPKVELLKNCLCEVLKVKGIRFVPPETFKRNPMRSWERLFNSNIKVYTPYLLLEEAVFDDSNTKAVLKNTGIKETRLDRRLILKLMEYSHSTKYGKINI